MGSPISLLAIPPTKELSRLKGLYCLVSYLSSFTLIKNMSKSNVEPDLLTRSRDFRRDMVSSSLVTTESALILMQLTPSGGWLHDVVVGASSLTGLSDYFLLGIIFVGSWCILRLAEREIALILGPGFDLTIPLQHSGESFEEITSS